MIYKVPTSIKNQGAYYDCLYSAYSPKSLFCAAYGIVRGEKEDCKGFFEAHCTYYSLQFIQQGVPQRRTSHREGPTAGRAETAS